MEIQMKPSSPGAADSAEDEVEQDLYSEAESLDLVGGLVSDLGDDDGNKDLQMDVHPFGAIDPEPYMSNQFYTFNRRSHHLMVQCIVAGRHPSVVEIQSVATPAVLACWRSVWKDRHESTAYLTGWKRIQDKLSAHLDEHGKEFLHFKNNSFQCVPYIEQWQDIVQWFHTNTPDFKHLGHKETTERIRQEWTVGAKLYGIPEAFVRVCVTACPDCGAAVDDGTIIGSSPVKRRRFEYTESFEVLASEVPQKLQQLAAKHKVVLCIRQKYIRYKPFLAEVKDYCCHRGGEPTSRKPGVLKRKRYMSKRCGCSFRIRAIVPITNYDEKDKTFSYQEEGFATFKLYAVHSGHEPGPHEGSARIIHRFVDPSSLTDEHDDTLVEKEEIEARQTVLHRVRELQEEIGFMEQNLSSLSVDVVAVLCQEVQAATQKLHDLMSVERLIGVPMLLSASLEESLSNAGLDPCDGGPEENYSERQIILHGEASGTNPDALYTHCHNAARLCNNMERDVKTMKLNVCLPSCLQCGRKDIFGNDVSGLGCDCLVRQDAECGIMSGVDSRVNKDRSLAGIQVENYCADNDKWYEGVSCSLDPARECGDDLSHPSRLEFEHEIAYKEHKALC